MAYAENIGSAQNTRSGGRRVSAAVAALALITSAPAAAGGSLAGEQHASGTADTSYPSADALPADRLASSGAVDIPNEAKMYPIEGLEVPLADQEAARGGNPVAVYSVLGLYYILQCVSKKWCLATISFLGGKLVTWRDDLASARQYMCRYFRKYC